MDSRIHDFDVTKIFAWNSENIRKYKTFIEKFESMEVMFNLMLLDKQVQDLESNYGLVRQIRDNEEHLSKLIVFLKDYFKKINESNDVDDDESYHQHPTKSKKKPSFFQGSRELS